MTANFSYSYDALGNPTRRADGNSNISEDFSYDTLNRLTSSTLNVSPTSLVKNFSYDSIGNLLLKSDVGNYAYPAPGLPRPHGVVSVDGDTVAATFSYDANGNQTNATGIGRSIGYNAANKPASITQGTLTLNFADDVDHQRYKQTIMQGATVTTTRYLDAFGVHVELVTSATTQWNEYIMVGGSMIGVRFLQGTSVTLRYFHQDHLGSIAVLTDQNGAVVERDAYDPWGKRRFTNGNDDTTGSIQSQTIRGFTGQEMLASVGLVHLNGRVYDPYIGRMTSADPVVGDPLNGQTWNRYSYVYNNPLAFTDPTGYCPICLGTFLSRVGNGIGKFLQRNPLVGQALVIASAAVCTFAGGGPICAGIASSLTNFVVTGLSTGRLDMALQAAAITAASAAVTFGIGSFAAGMPGLDGVPSFLQPGALFKDAAHALVGCARFAISGGSCGAGALSGAVPAVAGSLPFFSSLPNVGQLLFKSVTGGLASVAGGGKFANGAVTGAFQYLFNDFQHKINQLELGNDAHRTLEDFAVQSPGFWAERYKDDYGGWFGGGRVDIGNTGSGELWDIKPDNAIGIFAGRVQVEYYAMMANATGWTDYQPGGVPGFMGPTIALPGKYGMYTYTYVGDGVITYHADLYSQYELVPLSVRKIVPIPSPAPILRVIPVIP